MQWGEFGDSGYGLWLALVLGVVGGVLVWVCDVVSNLYEAWDQFDTWLSQRLKGTLVGRLLNADWFGFAFIFLLLIGIPLAVLWWRLP